MNCRLKQQQEFKKLVNVDQGVAAVKFLQKKIAKKGSIFFSFGQKIILSMAKKNIWWGRRLN
jgi:hypothetical protein